MAFIDFCLQYYGSVGRGELMNNFGTAVASGTRDFTLYRELASNNLVLRHEDKRYYRKDTFQALFVHDSRAVLSTLAHGFGGGLTVDHPRPSLCEDAPDLVAPPQVVLATLSRAISQRQAVQLTYLSLSSGSNERVIIPHVIVNNGQRWHIRGYCRSRKQFRDFVCTRVTEVCLNETPVEPHEQQLADTEWNHMLSLELVPHPNLQHPEAIALDFGMLRENNQPIRRINICAARAGYLLRHWNVDCSQDHHLSADEHHLWLRNHKILEACANASLAPGFTPSAKTSSEKTASAQATAQLLRNH
ncbi:WYL domain-containing protein [Oceanisphaera marina]|uniref:WYL domain-containing protein n=1 Tax=Oceanisphaera marina TaxID=2017550 RepID=UPI00166E55B4|nr:WYL domain-containing protein [Oceanisphaera marina]